MAESKFVTLSIYGKLILNLLDVTEDINVTEEALLNVPVLKEITHNHKNVITSFIK